MKAWRRSSSSPTPPVVAPPSYPCSIYLLSLAPLQLWFETDTLLFMDGWAEVQILRASHELIYNNYVGCGITSDYVDMSEAGAGWYYARARCVYGDFSPAGEWFESGPVEVFPP